jgi:hypothetical protein
MNDHPGQTGFERREEIARLSSIEAVLFEPCEQVTLSLYSHLAFSE